MEISDPTLEHSVEYNLGCFMVNTDTVNLIMQNLHFYTTTRLLQSYYCVGVSLLSFPSLINVCSMWLIFSEILALLSLAQNEGWNCFGTL